MLKIGIECESIEDSQTWGVAREISRTLQNIAASPELINEFKFFLFFKSKIPDFAYLQNPIFEKRLIRTPFNSFSLYYYLFLPVYLWFMKLDAVYFPNYMLSVLFRGKSLVALTEDIHYEIHNGHLPFRYRLAYGIFSNWGAKHATKIMTFSESSRRAVSRLFKIPIEKISANYHGIDLEIQPATSNSQSVANYALYVGQAFPRRHLREVLLAFEKISPHFPGLKFIAVGKDKYLPPIIENLVGDINKRLGKPMINFRPYVEADELISLYKKAKFIVYVSESEAFGLPPIEALGYGSVPVVADAEITHEIFAENAFFVSSPITVETISHAMTEALTNENKVHKIKMEAGHIINRFRWSKHTERFLRLVRDIANNNK